MTIEQQIKSLISEVESTFPKQFTIDWFQELEEDFFTYPTWENDFQKKEAIMAAHYQVDFLLEIINPVLEQDFSFFARLEKLLGEWGKEFENVKN